MAKTNWIYNSQLDKNLKISEYHTYE